MQSLDTYPAASWRKHQRDYCEKVLTAATQPDAIRIGLEGPCGCGKSIGYLRAAMDRLKLAQGLGRALRTPEDQAVVLWQNNAAARELGLCPKTGRMIA